MQECPAVARGLGCGEDAGVALRCADAESQPVRCGAARGTGEGRTGSRVKASRVLLGIEFIRRPAGCRCKAARCGQVRLARIVGTVRSAWCALGSGGTETQPGDLDSVFPLGCSRKSVSQLFEEGRKTRLAFRAAASVFPHSVLTDLHYTVLTEFSRPLACTYVLPCLHFLVGDTFRRSRYPFLLFFI